MYFHLHVEQVYYFFLIVLLYILEAIPASNVESAEHPRQISVMPPPRRFSNPTASLKTNDAPSPIEKINPLRHEDRRFPAEKLPEPENVSLHTF